MKLSKEERETIVRCSAVESHWEISTADPKYIRRYDKLGYELVKDEGDYSFYRVPLRCVRFGRLEKRKPSPNLLIGRRVSSKNLRPTGEFQAQKVEVGG